VALSVTRDRRVATRARRLALLVAAAGLAACSRGGGGDQEPVPKPTLPLPTAGIAGQPVAVYPLTLITAEERLGWQGQLADRHATLARADSIIGALLVERSPEVRWVLPAELRRAAARAPGMLTNPDQMGTALLRGPEVERIPDPLRSQMRSLNGVAADRFALVPAALIFRQAPDGRGSAELVLVMADIRTGLIGWRTTARGEGDDPWEALRVAFRTLTPGLP
jgi:hypothetical protein